MGNSMDILGQTFGLLTCVEYIGKTKNDRTIWKFKCKCGNIVEKLGKDVTRVRDREKRNCGRGCLEMKKNQLSRTKPYATWKNMIARCTKQHHSEFKRYGGRGITICERWLNLNNFIEDMGFSQDGMCLDRIDSNKNYEPSNCRWVTQFISNQNTRKATRVTYNGIFYNSIREMGRELGISKQKAKILGMPV